MFGVRRSKYGNKKVIVDGIKFDSGSEARRYTDLKLLVAAGQISNLQLQVTFKFIPGVSYRADFTYIQNGKFIVEDVKGFETPEFKIKKKLFEYFYPELELRLVTGTGKLKTKRKGKRK